MQQTLAILGGTPAIDPNQVPKDLFSHIAELILC